MGKAAVRVKAVKLPYIVERKAYEIDKSNAVFESIRVDYPDFDTWFDKCRKEHRECWVLELDGDIAGLIIRKNETHAQAGTEGLGPKIIKICTFKVRDEFLGEKYGELLLKQVLWLPLRPRLCHSLPQAGLLDGPPARIRLQAHEDARERGTHAGEDVRERTDAGGFGRRVRL